MDYYNLNAVGPSFNGLKDITDTSHGCQRGDGGTGEKWKGNKMYKLPIKNKAQACHVQDREYCH